MLWWAAGGLVTVTPCPQDPRTGCGEVAGRGRPFNIILGQATGHRGCVPSCAASYRALLLAPLALSQGRATTMSPHNLWGMRGLLRQSVGIF